MSSVDPKYLQMTIADRLVSAGLDEEFYAAIRVGDRSTAIELIGEVVLAMQAPIIVDDLLARAGKARNAPAAEGSDAAGPTGQEAEDEDENVEEEEEDPTRVQFTLTVISNEPVTELEPFRRPDRRPREPDHAWSYHIHHFSLVDDDWQTRADKVDAGVLEALDILDATGVAIERLTTPNAWVRAHFTFTPGAETITAAATRRLAGYNATLWIDVLGG